ncbi:MAG: Type 1 glutamine amidotransferase-like domain-containing protein [Polyangiaceae bacterium]
MRGALLLNGNAGSVEQLVNQAEPFLLGSRHEDSRVREARTVLLVTAAWDAEHDESHVKRAINGAGLPSHHVDGYDRVIVNLSLATEMASVLAAESAVAEVLRESSLTRARVRDLYLAHNVHLVAMLRRVLAEAQSLDPSITLSELADRERSPSGNDATSLYRFALARELRHTLETLEGNDDRMVELSAELDRGALDAAGALFAAAHQEARARLEARVLAANVILVFGGNLDRLLGALRFFRLRDAFVEALRRGAVIVGTSAGAMSLCERIIVYDDFARPSREFQLWERGLDIVRSLQLLPHCMERIQTDDPDNLAYLARRFRHRVCVGLNEGSFLFVDLARQRAESVGRTDSVYVFGPHGDKHAYRAGEPIPLK